MSPPQPAYALAAPLDQAHDIAGFACGAPALDIWLQRHALNNELAGGSRTYVVAAAQTVVGSYSLAAGSVGKEVATGRVRRNMPDPVPAILLGHLAVDHRAQGQGLGGFMLRDASLRIVQASATISVRALLAHAIDDAAKTFYEARGFHPAAVDPLTLMITVAEAERSIRRR